MIPFYALGEVGGNELVIEDVLNIEVSELNKRYERAIPDVMEAPVMA